MARAERVVVHFLVVFASRTEALSTAGLLGFGVGLLLTVPDLLVDGLALTLPEPPTADEPRDPARVAAAIDDRLCELEDPNCKRKKHQRDLS